MISLPVPLIPLIHHCKLLTAGLHYVFSQHCLVLYMSRELYTASCVLCCGVCWLLCTACGSFHKYLWPLWCYSQALLSVRRLHHNTCIPRPAVRGLRGLGGRKPQPGPCYTFLWTFYVYDSNVARGWGEGGRKGGIRSHRRRIQQVNHNLFSLGFFGTELSDCWDGDVSSFVNGFIGPTLRPSPKYLNNFYIDMLGIFCGLPSSRVILGYSSLS